MKSSSRSIFNIFTLFTLLAMLIGIAPNSSAQADAPARPLNASGDFVWAKSMGHTGSENGNAIVTDLSGNVYTTGRFEGTVDFDPSFVGFFDLVSAGNTDAFISKLDANGNFVWAKDFGGTDYDTGYGIALDSSGNVYTTGYFYDTVDFDPGAAISNLTSAGEADSFISKLDQDGNFVWAKNIGGTGYDSSSKISVDASGNLYTIGFFELTADFDPSGSAHNLVSAGDNDVFISKLDKDGNFVWVQRMGGTGNDAGHSIALDSNSNVYSTGSFAVTADFNPGAGTANLVSAGQNDIFISKLTSSGTFVWAKSIGGGSYDTAHDIAADTSGNVYTIGAFYDATVDFNPGASVFNLSYAGGNTDAFISKLDSNGNFVWAKSIGGAGSDQAKGIVLSANDSLYITGIFSATTDFDPNIGTFNIISLGDYDIFISKLTSSGNFVWAKSMGGTASEDSADITLDSSANIYTTGDFYKLPADFDPNAGILNMYSIGNGDIFISKLSNGSVTLNLKSAGTKDGWTLESTEKSGKGGTLNSKATTFNLGDDAADKQYRAILSFDTSSIPEDATLTSVRLKVKKSGITGKGNPVSVFKGFLVDIKKGAFGKSTLAISDFQAKASHAAYGPFNTLISSNWYTINVTDGSTYINTLGLTQIRLRFKLDDNNNNITNILKLFSGNASAASRPQLIVEYETP